MQRRQHRIDEDAEDESADARSTALRWRVLRGARVASASDPDRRRPAIRALRSSSCNEASARPLGRQLGCRLLPSAMRAAVRACMARCELVGKRSVRYWLAFVVAISLHGTALATTKGLSQIVTPD